MNKQVMLSAITDELGQAVTHKKEFLRYRIYNLSDMAAKMEIIDSRAFSTFCGVDSSNQVPDGDTIGRFRALLVKHSLQENLFSQVVGLLSMQGLILKRDYCGLDNHRGAILDKEPGEETRSGCLPNEERKYMVLWVQSGYRC